MVFKKQYTEKRRHERLSYHCLVKYRPLEQSEDYSEVFTSIKNISAGGILIKLSESLPLGTKLKVRINIPALIEPIDAVAEVVRFALSKTEGGFWSGIKFLEINPGDKNKLMDFCTRTNK